MASEFKFDYFKSLYEEEESRYGQLATKAQIYQAMLLAYASGAILKGKDVLDSAKALNLPYWSLVLMLLLAGAALVCTITATRIRDYEVASSALDLLETIGEENPDDDDFRDSLITDLAAATETNFTVNNHVATWLTRAFIFLVLLALGHIVLLSCAIIMQ